MKIRVFDDYRSYFHVVLGFVAFYKPVLIVFFLSYEVLEYLIIKDKGFLGDLIEFGVGYGIAFLLSIHRCGYSV